MEKNFITINTFNGKFKDVEKIAPKYVVDVKSFEEKVQIKYDALRNLELENAVTATKAKFIAKLKENNLSMNSFHEHLKNNDSELLALNVYDAHIDYESAKNDLAQFKEKMCVRYEGGKIPKIDDRNITYFTWVMFKSKVELTITGMKAIISDCNSYGNTHFGSEKWSSERKADFTKIKEACIKCLSEAFDFSSSNGETYKAINVAKNFPSKETECVINAIYGKYDIKNAGAIHKKMNLPQATTQLLLAFFHWQGCDVETKKVKTTKLTALDV